MSYEGTIWTLCENGHLLSEDATYVMYKGSDLKGKCPFCTAKLSVEFHQDQTNGEYEEYPPSLPPILENIGFDDDPKIDHRGNHYFLKRNKYRPVKNSGQDWLKCN